MAKDDSKPFTTPFEIPEPMRSFAETSVDQARKAFDDFLNSARGAAERMDESASAVREGATSFGKEAMSAAERNVAASLDLAQKLVRAKDMSEVIKLQQDFVRAQMDALAKESQRLTELAGKLTGTGTKRG